LTSNSRLFSSSNRGGDDAEVADFLRRDLEQGNDRLPDQRRLGGAGGQTRRRRWRRSDRLLQRRVGTSWLIGQRLETVAAGAFGWGLFDRIAEAYRFLVFNYTPGDEIYIFGFSRGAFPARSLGGLIRKCGIIPRSRTHAIAEAYAL